MQNDHEESEIISAHAPRYFLNLTSSTASNIPLSFPEVLVYTTASTHLTFDRVARCPVCNRTVRYFGSSSGVKMIVGLIPDNACANSSKFCATNTMSDILESATWQPYI